MQLRLVLAPVEPFVRALPSRCPVAGCNGTELRLHQQVHKRLNDVRHTSVVVRRYRCCRCGHTFRVYPEGVTHAHTSRCVRQIAVLLYRLGLSYAMVSSALEAFGAYLCKSRVFDAVRAARACRADSAEPPVFDALKSYRRAALVQVRCMGRWLPLGVCTTTNSALVLSVAALSPDEVAALRERITPLLHAMDGDLVVETTDGAEQLQELEHGTT